MRIFSAKTDTPSKISSLLGRTVFDRGEQPGLGEVPGALDRSLGDVDGVLRKRAAAIPRRLWDRLAEPGREFA
jgi:hypothetical protein